jgi:hypothetical protein
MRLLFSAAIFTAIFGCFTACVPESGEANRIKGGNLEGGEGKTFVNFDNSGKAFPVAPCEP